MSDIPSYPLYTLSRLASAGAVNAVPSRIMAVLLYGGSGNTTCAFYNAASATGTQVIEVAALAGTTVFVNFQEIGGVDFSSKIYGNLAGTGGIVYTWYETTGSV